MRISVFAALFLAASLVLGLASSARADELPAYIKEILESGTSDPIGYGDMRRMDAYNLVTFLAVSTATQRPSMHNGKLRSGYPCGLTTAMYKDTAYALYKGWRKSADVLDAVQKSVTKLWDACEKTKIENVGAYFRTMADNALKDIYRAEKRRQEKERQAHLEEQTRWGGIYSSVLGEDLPTLPDLQPIKYAYSAEQIDRLKRHIISLDGGYIIEDAAQKLAAVLSADQLKTFYAKTVEELSMVEISVRHGLTMSTVQSQLRSVKTLLARVIPETRSAVEEAGFDLLEFWKNPGAIAIVVVLAIGIVTLVGSAIGVISGAARRGRRRQQGYSYKESSNTPRSHYQPPPPNTMSAGG